MDRADTTWLAGTWTGRGYWTDETGASAEYSVEMEIAAGKKGLHMRFQHVFTYGNDAVNAALDFGWLTDSILTLSAGGSKLGKG